MNEKNSRHNRSEKKLCFLASPIGNVKDLSLRSIELLESADLILCEDTRKTTDLIKRLNLKVSAPLQSLTSYQEVEIDWDRYLASLKGDLILYLSDAGTPLINDPGRVLLLEAEARSWVCEAVPGPSAPIVAIQRSGGFGLPFSINGYPPKKNKDEFFSNLDRSKTFVFFETKHELLHTLKFLLKESAERNLVICRELTKEHEEIFKGTVAQGATWAESLVETGKVGELTLILEGKGESEQNSNVAVEDLILLASSSSTKEKSEVVSRLTGLSKKECYKRIVDSLENAK